MGLVLLCFMSKLHGTHIFSNVFYEYPQAQDEKDALNTRERNYFIRGYVNRDNDKLRDILLVGCNHWAFVWHDRDDSVAHCHIICCFSNPRWPTALAKILRTIDPVQNWNFSRLTDRFSAFDYLYHRDIKSIDAAKARYTDGDVLTDDIDYFTRGGKSATDAKDFYRDLVEEPLTRAEMACKYGRDYLKNIQHYEKARNLIITEQYEIDCVKNRSDFFNITANSGTLEDVVFALLEEFFIRISTYGIMPSRNEVQQLLNERIKEFENKQETASKSNNASNIVGLCN